MYLLITIGVSCFFVALKLHCRIVNSILEDDSFFEPYYG